MKASRGLKTACVETTEKQIWSKMPGSEYILLKLQEALYVSQYQWYQWYNGGNGLVKTDLHSDGSTWHSLDTRWWWITEAVWQVLVRGLLWKLNSSNYHQSSAQNFSASARRLILGLRSFREIITKFSTAPVISASWCEPSWIAVASSQAKIQEDQVTAFWMNSPKSLTRFSDFSPCHTPSP